MSFELGIKIIFKYLFRKKVCLVFTGKLSKVIVEVMGIWLYELQRKIPLSLSLK